MISFRSCRGSRGSFSCEAQFLLHHPSSPSTSRPYIGQHYPCTVPGKGRSLFSWFSERMEGRCTTQSTLLVGCTFHGASGWLLYVCPLLLSVCCCSHAVCQILRTAHSFEASPLLRVCRGWGYGLSPSRHSAFYSQ